MKIESVVLISLAIALAVLGIVSLAQRLLAARKASRPRKPRLPIGELPLSEEEMTEKEKAAATKPKPIRGSKEQPKPKRLPKSLPNVAEVTSEPVDAVTATMLEIERKFDSVPA